MNEEAEKNTILTLSSTITMSDGDEGQPILDEDNQDSLNNETPNNTKSLLHKNVDYDSRAWLWFTVDDEDNLSLSSKEVGKGEGDTPEEGELYEFRYHDLLSVVEDDLGSPIKQQLAEVCHKILGNSKNKNRQNLKAFLFLNIRLLWKTLISIPIFILKYQTQIKIKIKTKIKQYRENRQTIKGHHPSDEG